MAETNEIQTTPSDVMGAIKQSLGEALAYLNTVHPLAVNCPAFREHLGRAFDLSSGLESMQDQAKAAHAAANGNGADEARVN